MTRRDLIAARTNSWRLKPELALTTVEEIDEFVDAMGMCVQVPKAGVALPSLAQALIGRETVPSQSKGILKEILSSFWEKAFSKRRFIEAPVLWHTPIVLSKNMFTLFYTVLKSRRIDRAPLPRTSRLQREVIEFIAHHKVATRKQIREFISANRRAPGATQESLDRALLTLWSQLDIIRTGFIHGEGMLWQATLSWDRSIKQRARRFSRQEALKKIVEQFIVTTIATTRRHLKRTFRSVALPQEIDTAINDLLLQGTIKVDPELIIGGKRALVASDLRARG